MPELERLRLEVQYLEGFLKVYLGGMANPSQERQMANDVQRALTDIRGGHKQVRPPHRVRVYSVRASQ